LLHPEAVESVGKLDDTVRRQLVKRLKILETQPTKGKRLRIGRFHSLRLGDFRVIYEI
jgi:mRNA-degrading endonuclease RelE of RelBE toxin-antitoxin system